MVSLSRHGLRIHDRRGLGAHQASAAGHERDGAPATQRPGCNFHGDTPFVGTTDAEGNTTTNTYDVRDRLASTEDPNNIVTSYGYDENNNLRTLTDGKGATRSWTYDERNLTVTKVMPDANDTVSYTYDALARLKVKTQQDNSTITMVYDLAGRMTSREYSDSTTDEFTYDEASRLLTATKGRHAITTTRTYADDGMMLSETQTLDNRTYTLQRSYDARNLVASAHYDGALVLTQQHDPGYRLTQQAFGNGLTREITYNRLDNLRTADKVKDGNTIIDELDFAYTYLADKNVEKETQANGTFEKLSFTAAYDAGNRVISYNRDDTYLGARILQSWNYDGAGNWDSTTIDGNTQNRTHSASDQLEAIAGDNLTYDPRGNLLADERGNEYEWDIDNRIVKSEGSGYSDIEYRYDALGRRIVREQGSNKEVLLWWGNTEQSEHKHQAGQTTIQNDLQANPSEAALNTVFARALEGSKFEIQYFHKNYLDHVMAVSADNGNLIEHYRYTAFGEPEIYAPNGSRLATTAIDNDILWNVRRYEPANGLYMYLYRDYDAASGRWPSRDPIGEQGGINLYGFVGNDGVNKWDYLGMRGFVYIRFDCEGGVVWKCPDSETSTVKAFTISGYSNKEYSDLATKEFLKRLLKKEMEAYQPTCPGVGCRPDTEPEFRQDTEVDCTKHFELRDDPHPLDSDPPPQFPGGSIPPVLV
jgi:RHS repeat-associated protein